MYCFACNGIIYVYKFLCIGLNSAKSLLLVIQKI